MMQVESYLFNVYAEVAKFSIVESGKRSYTLYQIDVKLNNRVYFLNKRFKDFDELNSKLRKRSIQVPELPSRHLMSRNSKALENRRNGLNEYLIKLIESFSGNLPFELVEFLELIETYRNDINIDNEDDEVADDKSIENVSNYPLVSIQDADFKNLNIRYTVDDIIINGILSELYS